MAQKKLHETVISLKREGYTKTQIMKSISVLRFPLPNILCKLEEMRTMKDISFQELVETDQVLHVCAYFLERDINFSMAKTLPATTTARLQPGSQSEEKESATGKPLRLRAKSQTRNLTKSTSKVKASAQPRKSEQESFLEDGAVLYFCKKEVIASSTKMHFSTSSSAGSRGSPST